MNDYEQLMKEVTTPDFQKKVTQKILEEKNALMKENYSAKKLLEIAAENMVYLKIQTTYNHILLANRINSSIDNLPHSNSKNERITHEVLAVFRSDAGKTTRKFRENIAKAGGAGKVSKDKDGKQKAKSDVKVWWEKWQKNSQMYKSKVKFSEAMRDKFPILESNKVIENWCREWDKNWNPAKQTTHPA